MSVLSPCLWAMVTCGLAAKQVGCICIAAAAKRTIQTAILQRTRAAQRCHADLHSTLHTLCYAHVAVASKHGGIPRHSLDEAKHDVGEAFIAHAHGAHSWLQQDASQLEHCSTGG